MGAYFVLAIGTLCFVVAFHFFIIGLAFPHLAIYWGERNRRQVVMVWGTSLLISALVAAYGYHLKLSADEARDAYLIPSTWPEENQLQANTYPI